MKQPHDRLAEELKKKGFRLSHSRRKILEYICKTNSHPTADELYVKLKREIPNLSKTTVYNTLHLLTQEKMIKVIHIEENEARFDGITKSHGHFMCSSCGAILDFQIDLDELDTEELSGFEILDKNLYFKGLCPKCLKNNKI